MALSKGKKLLILGAALVIIDQVIKVLVKTNMSIGEHFSVIGNWFQILFIENEGMAFGMKFGGAIGKYLLTFFRICLFAALSWWISRLIKRDKEVPMGVLVGLTLIAAGALGNIIDCLFYGLIFTPHMPFMQGRVVDMFYFPIIDTTWPQWLPWIGVASAAELLSLKGETNMTLNKRFLIYADAYSGRVGGSAKGVSLVLIDLLLKAGATVKVYDPVAMDECRRRLGDRVAYATDMYDAADGADALMLVTEWKEFRMPNAETLLNKMRGRLILDGRNILDGEELHQSGFEYHCIGK